MSDRKIYTSYIKYIEKNYSNVDWDLIFDKYLKISARHKPDAEDLKEASLKIYYSILLGQQTHEDYEDFLLSKKDSDTLRKLFIKNSKTMGHGVAVYYTDIKDAIKHIGEIGEGVTKKKQKLSSKPLKRSPVKKRNL